MTDPRITVNEIAILFLGWSALSFVAGVFVGRFIRVGSGDGEQQLADLARIERELDERLRPVDFEERRRPLAKLANARIH